MTRRTTVHDLQSRKGRTKWLRLHVDSAEEAAAADATGGAYPEPRHQVDMDDAAYDRLPTLAQTP